jgi:hypothetical protein
MSEPARHLRVVDTQTGETYDEHPELKAKDDEIRGLQRALAAESRRYENLRRDKDAEAREHQWWEKVQDLFKVWQQLTGHTRCEFDGTRFWLVEPFLRRKKYGYEICVRAVAGRIYDHYSTPRKNGSVKHYWEWERIFKDSGELEESANRAPKGWRDDPVFASVLEKWS